MKKINLFIVFLAIISLSYSCLQKEQYSNELDILDKYYQKSLKQWDVPGMAVGIVKDNQLIFAKGFGVKDIETNEAVDIYTNFAIASNTKAFTAAGIMILEGEGKLSLEDKVIDHLPSFKLYDSYVSDHMKIRDLLCHRSGLKTFSGDLIWYASDHSTEDIVRRARYLKPTYGFRESYGYSNILYLAAGLIIEKVSGLSWDNFMKQKFFTPLQMDRTITSTQELESAGNFVSPHIYYNKKNIKIPYVNWDNAKAMGGIISNVVDVAKWIQLQLNNGIINSDTIFTPEMQNEMWELHTINKISKKSKTMWPTTHFKGYGLGWAMFDYLGRKIISHTGGYDGTITATVLVPEEKLGIVILTNKTTSLYSPIMYKTLDVFLKGVNQDWSTIMLEKINNNDIIKETTEEKSIDHIDALDLEHYTGFYSGDVYGGVRIETINEHLYVKFDHTKIFHGKLKHLNKNKFEILFPDVPSLPKGTIEFKTNHNGKIESLLIDVPNPDFDFTELDLIKQNK